MDDSTRIADNLILIAILILSILLLRGLFIRIYKARKQVAIRDNFIIGINTISLIIIFVLLFFAFLIIINIDIKQFFTSISIIAAAIAIVSKDYISNAINGMILMFNTHLSIGDYIKIGEVKGKILNLTLMNMHLMNDEGDLVLIPNNVILATQIVNYTKGESRKAQLELPLPHHLAADIHVLENAFREAAKEFKTKAQLKSLKIKILNIDKDIINLKISMILIDNEPELEKQIRLVWLKKWNEMKG